MPAKRAVDAASNIRQLDVPIVSGHVLFQFALKIG
jgi:hypothetical protein